MTTSERNSLKRDLNNPQHLFELIVANNTPGVSNQMQSWGWTYSDSTPEQMVAALMNAYNAGGQAREQSLALVSKVKYRFGVFPEGFDEVITGRTAPKQLRSTDGQSGETDWYSDVDWGGIIAAFLSGVSGVIDSANAKPGSTPSPQPAPAPSSEDKQSQTQWIIIGVVAIALIAALFLAMRK